MDAERITLFTVEDMEDDENKDAKEAPKAKRGADVHKRDKSVVASALLYTIYHSPSPSAMPMFDMYMNMWSCTHIDVKSHQRRH